MKRPPTCQVEGCSYPLPPDRIYHKRYKICAHHATLPSMFMDGENVRFCQQCGRFQPLGEFEDGRKSCIKALEAHNEQRRRARVKARELAGCPPRRRQAPRKRSHSDCSQGISGDAPTGVTLGDSDSLIPPPPIRVGPAISAPAVMSPFFPGFTGSAMDLLDGIDNVDFDTLLQEGDLSGSGGLTPRVGGLVTSASMGLPSSTALPSRWGMQMQMPVPMAMSMPMPYAPARPSQLGVPPLATTAQQRIATMMHPALARWAQAQGAFAAAARAAPAVSPFLNAPFGADMPSPVQNQPQFPKNSTDSASSLMPLTVDDLLHGEFE